MTAKSRRTVGWILVGAALVLAAFFARYVLRAPEPEARPAGGAVLERGVSKPAGPVEIVTPTTDRAPALPPAEPEPPRTGALTGRVVTPERRVIHDARLEAFKGSSLGMALFASAVSLGKRTHADDAGRFTFADLPPMNDLMLRADGEGFALTDTGPFVIVAGQTTDVGDLIVSPGLTITGSTFDARGRPVAGAHVSLFQGTMLNDADGSPRPSRLVVSDAAGQFRIPDAALAPFTLRATAAGFANAEATGGPQPDDTTTLIEVPITLLEGRALRGGVLALPDHAPIRGARVSAQPLEPGHAGSTAQTDAQGRFEFLDLAPGSYQVLASATGHSETTVTASTATAEAEITIELPAQGSLTGFVVGGDDRPIAHFDLQPMFRVHATDPPEVRGQLQRVSNDDGAFRIDGLDPGTWSAQVWAKGYAVTNSEFVRVRQGESVAGVTVRMLRGSTLTGRVQDAAGQPVAGAEVWLNENRQPALDQPVFTERPRLSKSTRTDAEGHFELSDVSPDSYQVVVDHPEFTLHRRDDVVAAAGSEQDLPPFILARGATVEGVATTGNGQQLNGISVYLTDANGYGHQTTTDGKGHFLFQRVRAGDYRLSCYGRQGSWDAIIAAQVSRPDPFPVAEGASITRNVTCTE